MASLNYKAWEVDSGKFPATQSLKEKIKFLLNYAILAPSSHNAQPWKFTAGDNYLDLCADLARRLPMSDKVGRMLYMAVGCALANIKIAADYFSMPYEVICDDALENDLPKHAARINFQAVGGAKKENVLSLFRAITERRINRERYKNTEISPEYFGEFKNYNQNPDLKIDFISDDDKKIKISDIMSEAMGAAMSDKNFRRELAGWLRNNLTRKKDGMPGNGHGMSLMVSMLAPHILRNIDVSKVEAKKAKKRVLNFPALGIISSRQDNALSWFQTGELLEKILLAIQSKNMDSAVMVAMIEIPVCREKLRNFLQTEFFPQIFFGFGYVENLAPHSPRREIREFIIND